MTDLRNAAQGVVSSGDIEDGKSGELIKRVDQLSRQLNATPGIDAIKKVDDFDAYLAELHDKGTLTDAGRQRLAGPVQTLRDLIQP